MLKNLVVHPSGMKTSAEFFSCLQKCFRISQRTTWFPGSTIDHRARWNPKGKRGIHRILFRGLERGTIAVCAARAAVSKIVRPTVRRWRPMVGIQKLQPRPSNLNKNLFAGFVGLERSKFSEINHPTEYVNSCVVVGISIKIFCLNTKGNSVSWTDT